MTSNRIASIAALALAGLSISAIERRVTSDPCKLLSTSDASAALGEESRPGIPDTYQGCLWSHDAPAKDTSRTIYVSVHNIVSYNAAKHTSNTTIKIEPATSPEDQAKARLLTLAKVAVAKM